MCLRKRDREKMKRKNNRKWDKMKRRWRKAQCKKIEEQDEKEEA